MLSVDFVLSISHSLSLSLHKAVRHNYSSVETHKKLYNEETPGAYSSLRDESVCFFSFKGKRGRESSLSDLKQDSGETLRTDLMVSHD